MAISDMDYTAPNVQYSYDLNKSPFFRKDCENYINVLGVKQLNTSEDN